MRTTVTLDDALYQQALEITGKRNASELLTAGLKSLVAIESAKRLQALAGSVPGFDLPDRASRTSVRNVAEQGGNYRTDNP